MAEVDEVSIGWKKETTFGTPVTVDRWAEVLADTDSLTVEPVRVKGEGLRPGTRVARAARYVEVGMDGSGGFSVEAYSKGLGTLLELAFGVGVSTVVSGTTYQQQFTLGTPLPATIQKGVVGADTGGTVFPHTFAGCMAKTITMEAATDAIVKLGFDFDIRSMATATSYASPSYVAAGSGALFTFKHGAITVGGTVTAPTTTTLASGGTAVTNVMDFNLSIDQALSTPSRKFSAAGLKSKAHSSRPVITGTMNVEFDSATNRDAFIANTTLGVVLTFTSTEALSAGYSTLEVYLPAVKLTSGIPMASGSIPVVPLSFEAFDDETNEPIVVSIRTSDTAL